MSESLLWYKTKLPRSLSFSLPAIYWLFMTLGKLQNFSRLLLSYQTFPHQLWNKPWGQIPLSPCWGDDGQEPLLLAHKVETHCAATPSQDRKRHARGEQRRQDRMRGQEMTAVAFLETRARTRDSEEKKSFGWVSLGSKLTLPPFFFFFNMDHFSSLYWFSYNVVLPCFCLFVCLWVFFFGFLATRHVGS